MSAILARSSPAAVPGVPSIYIYYNDDCTFSMSTDGGYTLPPSTGSGPTLPPGTYQLLVTMMNPAAGYSCQTPTFSFTGPGVNSVTVFPDESIVDDDVVTLQPSSTYVALEESAPTATERSFQTAATGSSTSLLPTTTTTEGGTPKGAVEPDILGSGLSPYRGKLVATVGATGKASLTRDGRGVGSLAAGRYDLVIADRSRRAGFLLRRGTRTAEAMTGVRFVGRETRKLTLVAGQWSFSASGKKPFPFIVVAK